MGNLLGSPVTDKETNTGETTHTENGSTYILKWGLSSMQGWRVHMEDAHIAECNLYAWLEKENVTTTNDVSSSSSSSEKKKNRDATTSHIIPLPGHSLFACFDGHGGTFSADYAGRNFLRILSKQPKFVEYAEAFLSIEDNINQNNTTTTTKQSELHLLLEQAFQQAFVETDYEIALAIRGDLHPHANQPYHHHWNTATAAASGQSDNDDDVIMKQSVHDKNDNTTTNDDTMRDAAGRAAANHVQALDDDGDSGTTACMVLVTPYSLVCANAGDSRAIFSRKNATNTTSIAIPLSFDHKPDDEMEERRIRAAGGYVAGGRVAGDLAVSRNGMGR